MFTKPETFEGLSIEDLKQLLADAKADGRTLAKKEGGLTAEEITQAETLMQAAKEIADEITVRETAEAEAQARIDALREAFPDEEETEAEAEATPEDHTDDGDGDAEEESEADAEANEEVVVAAAPTKTVAKAARQAKAPAPVEEENEDMPAGSVLIAAANVPGVDSGAEFADMLAVSKAFQARSAGFIAGSGRDKPQVLAPEVYGLSDRHQRYGVANIKTPENEFTLNDRMSDQDSWDMMIAASKEARLPGNSLVAAGGWCAPSEQVYGFCELETVSGLVSLPEVTARRGGISFTKGPDYASIAASWGFLQTEAQAIAGTAKSCYSITCPAWTEVRLDAVGFCITAPVLTNTAFPELINRVLQIGAVAHAHKVNASIISRLQGFMGTAVDWTEVGGSTSDVLDAAELTAARLRYTYAMDPNATIEAIFPVWALGALRADVGRRMNIENPLNVTDDMIKAWFTTRKIAPQFVYDYQNLDPTSTTGNAIAWSKWPTALEFMMYPAGAFTKLTLDVISLDTIYDSVGLGTNVYTAAFYEQGIALANTCASGVRVTVTLDSKGRIGAASI